MSVWNPFEPTQRDIKRTEKLATKNPAIAGILSFFFVPFAMLYLNRGINNLKIAGYTFIITILLIGMTGVKTYDKSDDKLDIAKAAINLVSFTSSVAMVLENIRAVTLARKRKSQEDLITSEPSSI
ncbi:MAG: hypothetical protein AAF208_06295 [Cyanobacteria bacterium P01_A01_bin.45]